MDLPKIILIPLLAGFIAQIAKIFVELSRTGKFNPKLINAYGGMPSSHTALVVSLAMVVGLAEGVFSAAFALAIVVALITIRDAIGLRVYLGEHARILNKLIEELPAREKPSFPHHILERIGHRPSEAVLGGLVGVTTTIILWLALP